MPSTSHMCLNLVITLSQDIQHLAWSGATPTPTHASTTTRAVLQIKGMT